MSFAIEIIDTFAGKTQLEVTNNTDEDGTYVSSITIKSQFFKFSMFDLCYDNVINDILDGKYDVGGNSRTNMNKCNGYYEFCNNVSGSGGDSSTTLTLAEETVRALVTLMEKAKESENV